MDKGSRVMFVGWFESDTVMTGTISKINKKQTGNSYLIACDMGGNYEIPERSI